MSSVVLLLALLTPAQAQSSALPATLSFHFERPGLPVPVYTLTVHEDGSASYIASYSSPPQDTPSRYGPSYVSANATPPATEIARSITISPQTTALLFERVRSTANFRDGCESTARNVANSGAKTIIYNGADGTARCTFNYSDNKAVAVMTATFVGIAATLDEGRILDMKHKYDRLGLDHELSNLIDALHEGRATEVGTITPVLQSLCDDPLVMERVRKRAAGLLASIPTKR